MFETGVRHLRFALSIVVGRRIDPRNVQRLVGDALATLEVHGAPGDDVHELLDGPFADPATRKDFQDRVLRRTVRRIARVSPYYEAVFKAMDADPRELGIDTIDRVPVTTKQQLIEHSRDLVARGSVPCAATRTTGTTGRPAEVWLSRYELDLWPALAALSGVLRDEIGPRDWMQINISSRATAAVQQSLAVCRLTGARASVLGLISPEDSLAHLGGDGPTLLSTYPSYLAQLVTAARRRGLGPDDFRLRRIDCGGEILSPALSAAAAQTFGAHVNETFQMTEILPVSGRVCSEAHLHHDLNMGFVEVVSMDGTRRAHPGELGTVVVTPYYPYRECMPLLRYDTRDVVRCLDDGPLACELSGIPATSAILGKADHVLQAGPDAITPRQVIEAVESAVAWPARAEFFVSDSGVDLVLAEELVNGRTVAEVEARLAAAGLRARVRGVVPARSLRSRPVRADLVENTFANGRS
jgi:phenylacetate-coenzyme A ligase PaaK-like adenylate-forming protein